MSRTVRARQGIRHPTNRALELVVRLLRAEETRTREHECHCTDWADMGTGRKAANWWTHRHHRLTLRHCTPVVALGASHLFRLQWRRLLRVKAKSAGLGNEKEASSRISPVSGGETITHLVTLLG